jgi:hypothetical protein
MQIYMYINRYISFSSADTKCHDAALPFTVHSVNNTAATHLKQATGSCTATNPPPLRRPEKHLQAP